MKKFRFIQDDLAGDVFLPAGSAARAAGMYLFGFPSFIGPNEVTRAMVQSGLVAFQPHYLGTYDSGGVFSPTSIVETCVRSQELFDRGFVRQVKDNSAAALPPLRVCVGHSFGTLVALRSARYLHDLRLLVLLGPTVHYSRADPDFGNKANGPKSLEATRISNRYTYRLASGAEWHDVMTGRDPLPEGVVHPSLERVVAVVGENDSYVDIPALRSSFDILIDGYCGAKVAREFHVVPAGGHTVDYLVEAPPTFSMTQLLAKYV